MCFRCVMGRQTVRSPRTNGAVGAGPPGVTGAPVLPPVGPAPEAGRGSVQLETLCSTVPGGPLRGRSASTPPALVRQQCPPCQRGPSLTPVCAAPVDGQWLSWQSWSNCSSCGGVQVRHRGCVPPRDGGRDCPQLPGPSNLLMEISKNSLLLL